MNITYSAPAKIILSGEHGVVYGKPALVSAINLRIKVTIQEGENVIQDPRIVEAFEKIHTIVKNYLVKEEIAFSDKSFSYSIENAIPLGRGMGSSAALSVASCASLLHWYTGEEYSKEIVNKLAYSAEKGFHGNPSGVDNSTSCYGGLIFFRKEFEFLKNISALNFKLPKNIEEHLFLIDTGKPTETTAEMVALVGKNYNNDPKQMELTLHAMEKVTKRMVVSIVKEDPAFFKLCIQENKPILENIGIVSSSAKEIMKSLEQFGAGKITGAGGSTSGSGFILFFADDPEQFTEYLNKETISYVPFEQDFEGVKKELV